MAPSTMRRLLALNGLLVGGAVLLTQFVAVYPISFLFGPDASYRTFVLGVVYAVVAGIIFGILGIMALGWNDKSLSPRLRRLWFVQTVVIAGLLLLSFVLSHGYWRDSYDRSPAGYDPPGVWGHEYRGRDEPHNSQLNPVPPLARARAAHAG